LPRQNDNSPEDVENLETIEYWLDKKCEHYFFTKKIDLKMVCEIVL